MTVSHDGGEEGEDSLRQRPRPRLLCDQRHCFGALVTQVAVGPRPRTWTRRMSD